MTSYNIYLATKPEKYALLDQLRAVGAHIRVEEIPESREAEAHIG